MSEATRKLILERYVARYEEHVTPGMIASVPAHGNEHMASEIMAVGPIQLDDLNLDLELEEAVQVNPLSLEQDPPVSQASKSSLKANHNSLADMGEDGLDGGGGSGKLASTASDSSTSNQPSTSSSSPFTVKDSTTNVMNNSTKPSSALTDNQNDDSSSNPSSNVVVSDTLADQLIVECELGEEPGSDMVLVKQEKTFNL